MASELEVGKVSTVTTNAGGDVTALQLRNGASNNSTSTSLRFVNSAATGTTAGGSEISSVRLNANGGAKLVIKTANDVNSGLDERLTIDSTGLATFSNGINLGDTTLSNYAEGSFTPTISAENGTISGTNQEGRYTRIGNVCHIWFTIECTGVSSASGSVNFGSLPFTSASSGVGYQTPMVVRYLSLGSAVESVVLRLFNNSTGGRIEEQTGTTTANLADNVQNGTVFQVAGSYRI